MTTVSTKTRTVTNGTPVNAIPVEANFVDLYNNDFALAVDLTTAQGQITTLQTSLNPTGIAIPYFGAVAPAGWLFCSGKTIGNGVSGGTSRANADTLTLFTLLWTTAGNSILPIQDSTGAASTRGANPTADFNANKRFPLPDMRGRNFLGLDNLGGTTAGRITSASLNGSGSSTLGAAGGEEAHVQSVAELAAHTHSYQDSYSGSGSTYGGASAFTPTDQLRTTNNTGSSTPMNVMNPWMAWSIIIKL